MIRCDTLSEKPADIVPGLLWVVCLFILSRILYIHLGLLFVYPGGLQTLPQLISAHLLRTDLWRSLFYLHSQPPLFNLFVGMILQLFPGYEMQAFQAAYLILGLVCAATLYLMLVKLTVSPAISVILVSVFMLGPSAFFYETNINYEYPVMAMLLLSALCLMEYLEGSGHRYLFMFSFLAACIILTRSTFQIIWLLFIIVFLVIFRKGDWKKILLYAGVPVLLAAAWYVKNLVLFDQFTTSSWLGMNISRITMYCIPEEWRIAMVDQHEISELGRLRSIFDYPLEQHQEQKWGVPVLDDVYKIDDWNDYNFNNINIIQASREYFDDSMAVLKKYPRDYIYCVLYAQYAYFQAPFEYGTSQERARLLVEIENIYSAVFYSSWVGELECLTQHWREDVRSLGKWLTSSTFLFCGYLASFFYLGVGLIKIFLGNMKVDVIRLVLIYLTATIFYITVVSTMLDIGENFRFRYMADPYFVIVLGVAVDRSVRRVRDRIPAFRCNKARR